MQAKIISGFLFTLVIFNSCSNSRRITGDWVSVKPEKSATGTFGVRAFTIGKDRWTVEATVYLDSAKKNPVFTFTGMGSYRIIKKSVSVTNADEAVFGFDKKYITLKTADSLLIKKFGLDKCELEYLVRKDITENGCSFFASKTICAEEYDLIYRSENQLFLGARPPSGGICEISKRPITLGSPLNRIKNKY